MQRICLVLLAAAVVSTAQEQSRVQGEARLGANLSKVVLRRATKIENAEVQGYVEGLVRRLAQQFRKYEFPFTVAILEDDDRMLEPQTLPGGYLFLKASHILEVRSEAGLARILAHAMAHIGDSTFYRQLSRSFPANATILLEGVTDNRNLLTNKITYKRMATSLGVAEQQNEFQPRGNLVQADVDVEQFTTNTIDFLNLVMLVHSKGVNAETVPKLLGYSPPPHFGEQLMDDLLRKRNRQLLGKIHAQLSQSDSIIVPWGAAHIPEIAREIQKSGFRLTESREYLAIRFRSVGNKTEKN